MEDFLKFVCIISMLAKTIASFLQREGLTSSFLFDLIATKSELGNTVLGKPIVVVVEAKQNNFTEGWGQCLAELVAAQKLNRNERKPVYGLVTDAEVWQFGKLEDVTFTKHRTHITTDNLAKLDLLHKSSVSSF